MTATKLVVTSITKDSPGAGQWTAVGTYTEDVTYSQQAQRNSVGNFPTDTVTWSRYFTIATDAIFSRRNGATAVALEAASFAKIAYTIEPDQTYAPSITTDPSNGSCVASSTAATFTVAAASESTKTYQWQYETKASGTITTDNTELADGDTVTINGQAYRFKDTMAQAYDVKRHGTTADTTLANLIKAINATGTPGTEYFTGTLVHPTVQADSAVAAHAVTLRARTSGTGGNALTLAKSAAHLSISGAVLAGGGTWNSASGTVLGCAYTNGTTVTLTCTPTTKDQSGTNHRCVVTNASGSDTSASATLTIT